MTERDKSPLKNKISLSRPKTVKRRLLPYLKDHDYRVECDPFGFIDVTTSNEQKLYQLDLQVWQQRTTSAQSSLLCLVCCVI